MNVGRGNVGAVCGEFGMGVGRGVALGPVGDV